MKKILFLVFLVLSSVCAWSKYGDVNGDGVVNAVDLTALYNILLNNESYAGGDVNFDNAINAVDITIVYNELLNGPSEDCDADYKMISDDLDGYIDANSNATYEQIIQYLTKYGDKVSSYISDDVLYVQTRDGRSIQIDLYDSFAPSESTEGEIDDSQMYQLLDDIEAALGNPGSSKAAAVTAGSSHDAKTGENDTHLYASSTGQKRVLSRRNILVWAPWPTNQTRIRNKVKEIATANKLTYKEILNRNCTLESMKQFANYDIVVLACHGTKKGEIILPKYANESYAKLDLLYGKTGYTMTKVKVDGKRANGIVPSYGNVKKYFPKLSKTILWTLMCHAYANNSVILKLAYNANAADFYGATNTINTLPLGYLKKFTPLFYNGSTSEKSFMSIANKRSIDYSYTNNEGKKVSGKYCMRALRDVVYQKPRAIEARDNKPRGVVRIDPSMVNAVGVQYSPSSKSSDSGSSDVEAGFWFKNTGTGEEFVQPFSQQYVENVEMTNYGDMIGQYVIEGKTESLDDGDYLYRTYIKIDGDYYYSDDSYELNLSLCPDNNHPHAIDLGLPSGTKWACCNIGANSPTEYGNYYAWGETQPKSVYNWDTYKWGYYDGNGNKWRISKYNNNSGYGTVDNKTELDLADDAAYVNWGSGWRMPLLTQLQELYNNCTIEWTTRNGVNGRLFTSNINGASVFLPAAGYRLNGGLVNAGSYGNYWSRTLGSSSPYAAIDLYFDSGDVCWYYNWSRLNGQSVRAVRGS